MFEIIKKFEKTHYFSKLFKNNNGPLVFYKCTSKTNKTSVSHRSHFSQACNPPHQLQKIFPKEKCSISSHPQTHRNPC